jgi:aspartate 1-decarboxylase
MLVNMLKSKIHRATVTAADLSYVGSVTIDSAVMSAANILPGEKVQVANINTGDRFETYTMAGEADSGVVCLNGAAARLVQPGDKVIIIAYCWLDEQEVASFTPTILLMDENNRGSLAVDP